MMVEARWSLGENRSQPHRFEVVPFPVIVSRDTFWSYGSASAFENHDPLAGLIRLEPGSVGKVPFFIIHVTRNSWCHRKRCLIYSSRTWIGDLSDHYLYPRVSPNIIVLGKRPSSTEESYLHVGWNHASKGFIHWGFWVGVVRVIPILPADVAYVRRACRKEIVGWRMGAEPGIVDSGGWEESGSDVWHIIRPTHWLGHEGMNTVRHTRCVQLALICDIVSRMSLIPF